MKLYIKAVLEMQECFVHYKSYVVNTISCIQGIKKWPKICDLGYDMVYLNHNGTKLCVLW